MGVQYSDLQAIDVHRLEAAAQQWEQLSKDFNGQMTDYDTFVNAPMNDGSCWSGAAADVAGEEVARYHNRQAVTAEYLDMVRPALQQAVSGVSAAKERLRQALEFASSAEIPVDTNGQVSLTGTSPAVNWYNPPIVAAMEAQNMINQAIHMANVVDEEISPLFSYATKFGQHDEGTWLTDVNADRQNANSAATRMQSELASIQTIVRLNHPDTAPQPYNVDLPNPRDLLLKDAFVDAAIPYFIWKGWRHAAAMFAHWLANTGTTAFVNPEEMINDIPPFKQKMDKVIAERSSGHFDSHWDNASTQNDAGETTSTDWWYAMNDFRYRVVGRSVPQDGTIRTDYTVGILKPYVFGLYDSGQPRKPIKIPWLSKFPGLHDAAIDQQDIAHLHTAGLAHNFIIQGISHHSIVSSGEAPARSPGQF